MYKVVAVSKETGSLDVFKAKDFSGKNAGLCYASDTDSSEKNIKRFENAIKRGHHSIADHVLIEVELKGISKMLAMVLNSLQAYTTSEQSARYTDMGYSDNKLYNKWFGVFRNLILNEYPDIDDRAIEKEVRKFCKRLDIKVTNGKPDDSSLSDLVDSIRGTCKTLPSVKLAQENARYCISVFDKNTTMGYSASLRQWNYIYDWCLGYPVVDDFSKALKEELLDLADFIKENLYVESLRDTKHRDFSFLLDTTGDKVRDYEFVIEDHIGSHFYNISYMGSFAMLAQAERHRTLEYHMKLPNNPSYFVPKLLRGTDFVEVWISDLEKVFYPQGFEVQILESGSIDNFELKCDERLCGRAQLEIMTKTVSQASRLNCSVLTKCKRLGGCSEPCYWMGRNEVFTRKV